MATPRRELEGRSLAILLPKRYQKRLKRFLADLNLQTRPSAGQICMGVRKDGREAPLGVSLAVYQTATGPKTVGTVADISQRRQVLVKY